MQKEENMLRNDTLSPASTAGIPFLFFLATYTLLLIPIAANELLVKINEMLNAETRKFFRFKYLCVSQRFGKRWNHYQD